MLLRCEETYSSVIQYLSDRTDPYQSKEHLCTRCGNGSLTNLSVFPSQMGSLFKSARKGYILSLCPFGFFMVCREFLFILLIWGETGKLEVYDIRYQGSQTWLTEKGSDFYSDSLKLLNTFLTKPLGKKALFKDSVPMHPHQLRTEKVPNTNLNQPVGPPTTINPSSPCTQLDISWYF